MMLFGLQMYFCDTFIIRADARHVHPPWTSLRLCYPTRSTLFIIQQKIGRPALYKKSVPCTCDDVTHLRLAIGWL